MRGRFLLLIGASLLVGGSPQVPIVSATAPDSNRLPPPASHTIDFRSEIHPLLSGYYFKCHKGSDPVAGYRLDLRASLLGKPESDSLVIHGKSAESHLIEVGR
jgi:hypothetical protein